MNVENRESLLKLIEEQKKIIQEQQKQIIKLSSDNQPNINPTRELLGRENNIIQEKKAKGLEKKKNKVSENLFGVNILNYVSVILIFLGFLYLLQYTLLSDWNAYFKSSVGYFSGLIIFIYGLIKKIRSNNILFGYAYTGLGLSIIYIVTFISCSLYGIMQLSIALIIAIIVTIVSILLSIKFKSQVVASLAIIGGYSSIMYVQWDGYANIVGFHTVSIVLLMLMYLFSLVSLIKYKWYEIQYLSLIGHYVAFSTIIYLSNNFNLNLIVLSFFIIAHYLLINLQLVRKKRLYNFNDYIYSIIFSLVPVIISLQLFENYYMMDHYKWFLFAFGLFLYLVRLSLTELNIKVCNYIYSSISSLYLIITVYIFMFDLFDKPSSIYNYKALYMSIIVIVVMSGLYRLLDLKFKSLTDIRNVSGFIYLYTLLAGFFCTIFYIIRINKDELILFLIMYIVYFGYYALFNNKKVLQLKKDHEGIKSIDYGLIYLSKLTLYVFTVYSIVIVITSITDNIYPSLRDFTSIYIYLGIFILDIFVRRLKSVNDKSLSILVSVIFGVLLIVNLISLINMPTSNYYLLKRISEGVKTLITIYYTIEILNILKANNLLKGKYIKFLTSIYTTIIMWIYLANFIQWKYEGYLLESLLLTIAFFNIYIGIKNKYKLMRIYGLVLIYTVIVVYFIFELGSMTQTEKILSTFTYGIISLVTTSIYFNSNNNQKTIK